MKKKVFLVIALICLVFVSCRLFLFKEKKETITDEEIKNLTMSVIRQRLETSFTPDILVEDLPASAWLLSQEYENCELKGDYRLGYDISLEISDFKETSGNLNLFVRDKFYELPFPDRIITKVHYSFYSLCPYEVALLYDGKGKDLIEWAKIFKDIAVVAGSPDGRELYGASEDSRLIYRMEGEKVKEIEIVFYSAFKGKIELLKKTLIENLRLISREVRAGDWVLRSQWNVPNSWIERREDFEDFSRIQLKDFSFSLSVPLLKGEIVLWNGYFVEGVLYFTYDNWRKASDIKSWFGLPEVSIEESRDGDLVEVRISDKLLKDIFSYIQQLINSNNCDILRKTILERKEK